MSSIHSKVFISHSSKDAEIAKSYQVKLKARGVQCWIYEHNLQFASNIAQEIRQRIAEADFLMVILSEASIHSDWVAWELGEAVRLQQERGGNCPIILPVSTYRRANRTPLVIQPRIMVSNDPIGDPIDFSTHRMHSIHANEEFEQLVRRLTPSFSDISDPREDEQAPLFEQAYALMERLFTDASSRPENFEITDHLVTQAGRGTVNGWFLMFRAMHFGHTVIGILYMSLHEASGLCWVTFAGIPEEWRRYGRFKAMEKSVRDKLSSSGRSPRASFFEVEMPDQELIRQWHESGATPGIPEMEEQARRVLRIKTLFESECGARILSDHQGNPIPVIQPAMVDPLIQANEKTHYLMIIADDRSPDERTLAEEVLEIYYSGFMAGWGPDGENLPGYADYLERVKIRQKEAYPDHKSLTTLKSAPAIHALRKAYPKVRL